MEEQNDPTCYIKMLTNFRTDSIPGRRLSALGFPGLDYNSEGTVRKPVKLNFDDTFLNESDRVVKKLKTEHDSPTHLKLNESYAVSSPWETRKMKADLLDARSEIIRLESRIKQMETVQKETAVLYQQEKRSLQQSLEKERNNTSEMEHRLHTLRKREAEMKKEIMDFQGSLRHDKLDLESKYQTLMESHMLLEEKHSELEMDLTSKVSQLEGKLSATEQQMQDVQEELGANKELVIKLYEELNEKRAELRLCESDKTQLTTMSQRLKELEYEKETHQQAMALVQSQQHKLFRLTELEKDLNLLKEENSNLRQAITNKLYLEDVVADLRSRVAVLQQRESEIVKLKVEVGVSETRLQGWTDMCKHILENDSGSGSPIDIRQSFERLQKSELVLTSENNQLKSKLKTLEEQYKESLNKIEALTAELTRYKLTIEQNTTVINRLRKQNSLIAWERNDLRHLVDSCQKEFTMTSTAALDLQHLNRIEALEKALDGYRKRHEELEGGDPSGLVVSGTSQPKSDEGSVEIAKLRSERDNLLREKEQLKTKVEELEHQAAYRALKGDFDVRNTKILHFKANPTATATSSRASDVEKMQEEILRLRERVQLLQEGKTHDLTAIVDERVNVNAAKEIDELKEKLTRQERQNQRLREVFKTTSHDFREAVNMLFGYKVNGLPNNRYKLLNQYAESPDQFLYFKMTEDGMVLLETPYSKSLGDLIELHLYQENSIPVFLSAITMQLFQKQTMCGSAMSNDDDTEIIVSD